MEKKKKEIMIEKYPKPISIEDMKIILNQMENNVCKIYRDDEIGGKGTGFFCIIKYNKIKIPVMMTNNHIIDEKYLKEKKTITISLKDDSEIKSIHLNNDRIIYTNKDYDITIIEIKEEDKIKDFMEIDEIIYKEDSNILFKKQSIYIIHYPLSEKVKVSYGVINNIEKYDIIHYCCTQPGSSGSPILNLLTKKVIGIHKAGSENFEFNIGTYLKYPVNDFINNYVNKIEIELKVNKKDINKHIYFLDNIDYIEFKNNINHYHDNLKELKESNTKLFINNKEYKYNKYFIPLKEGIYKIILKFNLKLKDCSFMFAGCKNIININFKYFNSNNITNMKYMFTGCINLKNLDLSSFNTQNVINMEGMFGRYDNSSYLDDLLKLPKNSIKIYYDGCNNLELLNISSFNTKNVINMRGMFSYCENLKELKLLSFDTKNVTNMSLMFYYCYNLKELDLSSLNTSNVTNMSFMFSDCNNLKELNISSFDTKNVTNMSVMFYYCSNLEKLDLSSFNTKNVINMRNMFCYCDKLQILNLSSFDTKNVTNMSHMFCICNNLEELDLSSFDTKNVTDMSFMFCGCKNLKKLNLSSFNINKTTNINSMFLDCNISNFNLSFLEKIKKNKFY